MTTRRPVWVSDAASEHVTEVVPAPGRQLAITIVRGPPCPIGSTRVRSRRNASALGPRCSCRSAGSVPAGSSGIEARVGSFWSPRTCRSEVTRSSRLSRTNAAITPSSRPRTSPSTVFRRAVASRVETPEVAGWVTVSGGGAVGVVVVVPVPVVPLAAGGSRAPATEISQAPAADDSCCARRAEVSVAVTSMSRVVADAVADRDDWTWTCSAARSGG